MEHDLPLSQTLQHIQQLKYRLKPAPPPCSLLSPYPRMGNVRRKYLHTVVYKWFLVTGSLHAPHIKVRLRLKFRSIRTSRSCVSSRKFVLHRCYLQAMDPRRKQRHFLYFSASSQWTYFNFAFKRDFGCCLKLVASFLLISGYCNDSWGYFVSNVTCPNGL
jgi:hypothetical protein